MYFFFLISGALRLDLKSSGMLGALSLSYIPSLNLGITKALSTVTDALWEASFSLVEYPHTLFPISRELLTIPDMPGSPMTLRLSYAVLHPGMLFALFYASSLKLASNSSFRFS